MKKVIIANAFSLQMLGGISHTSISVDKISTEEAKRIINENNFVSAIGHADTANVVSSLLGIDVPANRINVTIDTDTILIVAQIMGGRLPEGATALPEGTTLIFCKVKLISN